MNISVTLLKINFGEYRRANQKMDNPEKLATLDAQDTGQRQAKQDTGQRQAK